jgi:hypothetical protein
MDGKRCRTGPKISTTFNFKGEGSRRQHGDKEEGDKEGREEKEIV